MIEIIELQLPFNSQLTPVLQKTTENLSFPGLISLVLALF